MVHQTAVGRTSVAGLVLTSLGVLSFSLTFPATQKALLGFNPWTVGIGRAVIAAVVAGACLWICGARRPTREQLGALAIVGVGVVAGFPIFTALALEKVTSSHAAVVTGLLPFSAAVFGRIRGKERPSPLFWWASGAGAVVVAGFVFRHGVTGFGLADLLLVGALVTGGLGYAEGGRLARTMPGWQVIAWGLILSLPVTAPITVGSLIASPPHGVGTAELVGLGYVGLVSMFLGFCAWYSGLARAGVTRGSQVQLFQPLLTVGWAALLLGESLDMATLVAALLVLICVGLAQWAKLTPASPSPAGAPSEPKPLRSFGT